MEVIKPRPVQLNMVEVRYNNLHEVFLFIDAHREVKNFEIATRKSEFNNSWVREVNVQLFGGGGLSFNVNSLEAHKGYLVILSNDSIRYFNFSDYHSLFMTDKVRELVYSEEGGKTLKEQELVWSKNPIYKPIVKNVADPNKFFEKVEDN